MFAVCDFDRSHFIPSMVSHVFKRKQPSQLRQLISVIAGWRSSRVIPYHPQLGRHTKEELHGMSTFAKRNEDLLLSRILTVPWCHAMPCHGAMVLPEVLNPWRLRWITKTLKGPRTGRHQLKSGWSWYIFPAHRLRKCSCSFLKGLVWWIWGKSSSTKDPDWSGNRISFLKILSPNIAISLHSGPYSALNQLVLVSHAKRSAEGLIRQRVSNPRAPFDDGNPMVMEPHARFRGSSRSSQFRRRPGALGSKYHRVAPRRPPGHGNHGRSSSCHSPARTRIQENPFIAIDYWGFPICPVLFVVAKLSQMKSHWVLR